MTAALARHLDGLSERWRWAITKAETRGWPIFALNDAVRPTPGWSETDWSKRPRRRCRACRAAGDDGGLRGLACLQVCGHPECHGLLGASADVGTLLKRARRYPWANTALRTGPTADVLVLDVDGEAGERSLDELEARHGEIPRTRLHLTGGGTPHYYFRYPRTPNPARVDGLWRNSAGQIGKALDIRAEGGLVVLPGSVSRKGRYDEVLDLPEADAPGWLLDLMASAPRPPAPARPRLTVVAGDAWRPTLPGEVHPYVAATVAARVAEFAALTTEGNARSTMVYKTAYYLSGFVDADPPTGLTAQALDDTLTAAAVANGFAAAHCGWHDQIANGLRDGAGKRPTNWPPPERPALRLVRTPAASPDELSTFLEFTDDACWQPALLDARVARFRATPRRGALMTLARAVVFDAACGAYPGAAALRAVATAYRSCGGEDSAAPVRIFCEAIGREESA